MDGDTNPLDYVRKESQNFSKKPVYILSLATATIMLGFGIIMPLFPYYLDNPKFIPPFIGNVAIVGGILMSTFSIVRFIMSGPMGALSDRLGRKPLMLISILGYAVVTLSYVFANSFWDLVLIRIFQGLLSSGFMPAASAYISDVSPIEQRGQSLGILMAGNMIGFIFGPMVGGILSIGPNGTYDFVTPFVVASILSLVTFVTTGIFVKESLTPEKKAILAHHRATSEKGLYARLELVRSLFLIFVIATVMSFGSALSEGVLGFFGKDYLYLTPLSISLVFSVFGIFSIISQLLFSHYSDKHGRRKSIIIGLILITAGYGMFAISTELILFGIGIVLLASSTGFISPAITALAADKTSLVDRGKAMGIVNSASSLGRILGPVLGTWMYAQNYRLPFYMTLFVMVITILLSLKLKDAHNIESL